ncbi:uncharacterized protein DDB_G0286299-like [Chenopodium quinoa]|uniref:uncharacterized protein DDB_G0286299-like n=1 Tax=Chenopodium quinoa TaxID=63459 RepID=UPI000B7935D6|nr:uncharacterized protein DDB_G0286299-like [Chenopodium quinoa]
MDCAPGSSKEVITDGRRFYTVKFFGATKEVICDCRKFETHGILCKHCIRILDQNFVFEPPKKYILDRWRKDIPRKHTRVKVPYYDPSDDVVGRRFNKMMTCFELICDSAAMVGDEAVDVVMNSVSKLRSQVDEASRKKRDQTKAIRCIAAKNRTSPGQAGTTSSVGMPDAAQHTNSEGNPLDTPSGVAATANVKDPIIKKKRPGRPKESRHKTLAELGYRIPKAKAKKGKGVSPDEYLTSPAEPPTQSKCKRKGQTLIKAGNNKKQKKGNISTQPMCKNRPKAKASTHNEATGSSTPPVLKPKNYTRKKAKSTIPSAVKPKANNTNSMAKSTIPSAANPKAKTKSIGKSITPSQLKSKANSNTKLNSKTSDIANTYRVTPATQTSCVQVPGEKGKLPAKRKGKPHALLDSANWVSDLSATF